MSDEIISRDQNHITVLAGVTDDAAQNVMMLRIDPTTKRLLVSAIGGGGGGTVTSVSVVTANGISGTVATATITPAITLTLGAITPTSVNSVVLSGSATPTLAVAGTASISGSNTGDQNLSSYVVGPANATTTAIAKFSGTSGKIIQNSLVTIDSSGNIIVPNTTGLLSAGELEINSGGNGMAINITAANATVTNTVGGTLNFNAGNGLGSGLGGNINLAAGAGDATGVGGYLQLSGGTGGGTSGNGGAIYIIGGVSQGGNSNGGNVIIYGGSKTGSGTNGQIILYFTPTSIAGAILDVSQITSSNKTFTFPNKTGTLALLSDITGSVTWTEVTGTTQSLSINNGYILNNTSLVTGTLPATAALGSIIEISGKGIGGWKIAQNAGQIINLGNQPTTAGTGGSIASTNQWDTVTLLCVTANTTWVVLSSVGNITVV